MMKISELRDACAGGDYVLLYLPAPNSQGYTRRLCGRHGPRGEVINGTAKGQIVRFLSKAVLRCLDKIGAGQAVETEGTDD